MPKVYLFSNIYPLYRRSIWNKLIASEEFEFHFFFSSQPFKNIKTAKSETERYSEKKRFKEVKNILLFNRLIWQRGVLKRVFDETNSAVFLAESTCLSTWLATILFRLRGVKVIFWGHGLYGNETLLKKTVRLLFHLLPDHNLVYEKRAKSLLVKNGFHPQKISLIYNSINYEEQLNCFNKLVSTAPPRIFKNNYPTLLFIGRLTAQKKIELLIDATIKLNERRPFNLLIIGKGKLKKQLEEKAGDLIKKEQCIFYGEAYDEKEISKLIFNSDLTVSPGNIGLTAIHSLSYGTPICSHSNFKNQMPEVESIIEGVNGFLFEEDNVNSLVNKILNWFQANKNIDKIKIRSVVEECYNPNSQYEIIRSVLK
jgi:glycosyltransferase involved in cell wall biosynthesis